MKTDMSNFIHEDYIVDLNICDELVKWFHLNKEFHSSGSTKSSRGGPDGQTGEIVVDHKMKKSVDFGFDYQLAQEKAKVVNSYFQELHSILERYLQVYSLANQVEPFGISEFVNIQHYKPYDVYRDIHCERSGFKSTMARHLVFQTYLNTVKDGGETEFIYQQYQCKAIKGKTLIWPADWTHSHRGIVSPTEDKYIITGWYSFI